MEVRWSQVCWSSSRSWSGHIICERESQSGLCYDHYPQVPRTDSKSVATHMSLLVVVRV